MARTMGEIAARYDERRNHIIKRIKADEVSASMSGIEYYPKPWADLDMTKPEDLFIISGALTWDDGAKEHTHESLRELNADELALRRRKRALSYEPSSYKRELENIELDRQIKAARP